MFPPKEPEICIGIDFGTSNTCCGIYMNGAVKIAPNKIGERITPSVLLFNKNENDSKDELLVGEKTVSKNITDLKNYIYEIKRFIGLSYEEVESNGFKKSLNYNIENKDGVPVIKIEFDGQPREFTVEELCSYMISNVIQNAKDFIMQTLNKEFVTIKSAIFTIPTQFKQKQKESILEAAKMAGIQVPRLIFEPTAAALAYGIGHDLVPKEKKKILLRSSIYGKQYAVPPSANEIYKSEEKVLSFDLGGGTLDISILKVTKDKNNNINFEVKSTYGDIHLGGSDFDQKLIEYCIDYFCEDNGLDKKDIFNDYIAMRKLKIKCENAKKLLSVKNEVIIHIDNLYENNDLIIKIKQDEFENICKPLFNKIQEKIEFALKNENCKPDDIDKVILVGGATRMYGIKKLLNPKFGEKKIKDDINPDEAVAIGATLNAAKLQIKDKMNFNLLDIISHNIGIEAQDLNNNVGHKGGILKAIIKKFSKIPCQNEETFKINLTNEYPNIIVKVYEGSDKDIKKDDLLGEFKMDNIEERGTVQFIVGLGVDVNGKLNGYVQSDEINKLKERIDINFTKIKANTGVIIGKKIRIDKNKKFPTIASLASDIYDFQVSIKKSQKLDERQKNINLCSKKYKQLIDEYKKFTVDKNNFINSSNNIKGIPQKYNYNEFLYEKIFLYTKELFSLYLEIIILKNEDYNNDTTKKILNEIKEKMNDLIEEPNYVEELLSTFKELKSFDKNKFYIIFNNFMEIMNVQGSSYISEQRVSRYYALSYFENVFFSIKKYVENGDLNTIDVEIKNNYDNQKKDIEEKLNKLKSFATYIEFLVNERKFLFGGTGFTLLAKQIDSLNENPTKEQIMEILDLFINMGESFDKDKKSLGEAYCLANIIRINYKYLDNKSYDNLREYIERLDQIMKGYDDNFYWIKDIKEIIDEIKNHIEIR